ncbi:MAG: ABC transporter substrate-binding protein [Chloroflexi bacterium]|nr:ABC transporter substrate-binding protein [Chloroflexota bacterium]
MKNIYRPRYLALWILVAALSACTSTPSTTRALTPVTVQLRWTHQSQFAGFYAADQKGYYAAEGLAVTFLLGGPDVDLFAPIASGAAQFGIAAADRVIVQRADGVAVRAIGVIYRRNATVFIALAASGISKPQDFAGKTIRLPLENAPTFYAMMERVGIRRDQYTVTSSLPSDVTEFASGKVPVWSVNLDGLAVAVQKAGYRINLIYPDDYGIHFYGDTLFTTDDLMTKEPDLVKRFLRATLKGWTFAVENPSTVGASVAQYKPDADVELENARMIPALSLVNTGEDYIGWMKPEVWAGMEKILREQNVLTKPVDVTQAYTMQFVKEIYGK